MLVMVVFFIAFRWIHLSTPLIRLFLLVLILLLMPTLNFLPVRSEERFSRNAETDLVCRLLLEKKKRGMVAGARPDLEDPLSRFEGRFLEHDRNHRGRRDRLAGSDRQGDVLTGLVPVLWSHESLPRHREERSPDTRPSDVAGPHETVRHLSAV